MATQSEPRLQILQAVSSLVAEASESRRILHTANVAGQLAERYPACGMTLREIEDEVIRQVGLAHGVAEIGDAEGVRPVPIAPQRHNDGAAMYGAEPARAPERACRR